MAVPHFRIVPLFHFATPVVSLPKKNHLQKFFFSCGIFYFPVKLL